MSRQNGKYRGTVTWFKKDKGYGFIHPDNNKEDVFVHYSGIEGKGQRNLEAGQVVEYSLDQSNKPNKMQAVDVIVLGQSPCFRIKELLFNDQPQDELIFEENRDHQIRQIIGKVETELRAGNHLSLYIVQEMQNEL